MAQQDRSTTAISAEQSEREEPFVFGGERSKSSRSAARSEEHGSPVFNATKSSGVEKLLLQPCHHNNP